MFRTSSVQQTATFFPPFPRYKYDFFICCILTIFPLKLHQGDTVTSSLKGVIKFWGGTPDILGLSCLHFLVLIQITLQLDEAMISAGLRNKEKCDSFQMSVLY